jgi:site-specific recombinase XerC
VYEVGEILGHASTETTKRYAHLQPGHLRRGISAIDKVLDGRQNLDSAKARSRKLLMRE